ncbi:MAG TPA: hypothetical protein VFJ06_03075, partial [Halococcus sp.]|nr:hypothetical protein [Halococcus sp.]
MGYKQHLTRGAVVALLVLTVFGMTAAPVMAHDTTATDDCDLVDIDGDNNDVSVNMEDSEVNINCGDGGDIGGSDTADTGSDADTGDEAMTVHVNGDEVDVSEQQDAEHQDAEVQNVENDAGDQNVESGAGDQNVEND